MAAKQPRKYNIGPPSFNPGNRKESQKKHFFLDGKLYKVVREDRGANLLTAWSFDDEQRVTFILSDAKRRMKNAYDTVEAAAMLNRTPEQTRMYISQGVIKRPRGIYAKGRNKFGHPFDIMKWSDADIIALHDFLLTNGGGPPRKDGLMYSAARIPNRNELLAMLRNQPLFYMKTSAGEFIPVWSAYNEV